MKYSDNGFFISKQESYYLVGLSEKGQDDLGDISFLEVLSDNIMDINDSLIGVEASKAVTELTAPINGKIIEVNNSVVENPSLLNEPVKLENWLFKVIDIDEATYYALSDTNGLS